MTAPPGLGEADVDPAPVQVTQGALDQAVLLQLADHPGQRALAQVHGFGQLLDPELVLRVLGQALQDLELADAQPVPLAEVPFQCRAHRGVGRRERAPRAHDLRMLVLPGHPGIGHADTGLLLTHGRSVAPTRQ